MSTPDSIERVRAELESSGYKTRVFEGPKGAVVAFDYTIEVGSKKGEQVSVGVSFQGSEDYPEHPPHWIHVSPPIHDGKEGAVEKHERDGEQWLAMSRPPGDLWDNLPTKYMGAYINEHLRRIWRDV